jgi:hypothetical protein
MNTNDKASSKPVRTTFLSPLLKKLLLVLLAASLYYLFVYSDTDKLPQPPLLLPFDTQKAGFKIETDIRVVDYHTYEFGFKLGFKEGDATDRARVEKLAGDYGRDKAGKLIHPGVPIPLRIRIEARKPSTLESVFEREFLEEEMYAIGDTYFRTEITTVKLKPGTYHLMIENFKEVPELKSTPVTLTMTSNPKSYAIAD